MAIHATGSVRPLTLITETREDGVYVRYAPLQRSPHRIGAVSGAD